MFDIFVDWLNYLANTYPVFCFVLIGMFILVVVYVISWIAPALETRAVKADKEGWDRLGRALDDAKYLAHEEGYAEGLSQSNDTIQDLHDQLKHAEKLCDTYKLRYETLLNAKDPIMRFPVGLLLNSDKQTTAAYLPPLDEAMKRLLEYWTELAVKAHLYGYPRKEGQSYEINPPKIKIIKKK